MKKIIGLLVILATTLFLVSCSKKETLELYLPNQYISDDLISEFEEINNVRVSISNFDSNEIALGMMETENYDLVVPSDYAIEELAHRGLLEEIDYKELLGDDFMFAEGLDHFLTQLKGDGFDFLKYAVPYFWGSVGILYNNTIAELNDAYFDEVGFNVIANSNYETVIYDSSRDAYMMAMLASSNKMLTEVTSLDEIKAGTDWLIKARKQSNTRVLSDEILTDLLTQTKYDAVLTYSGDAAYIMDENSDYSFYIPEKSNVWADGFVIPKNAKNKELAKKFITFMNTYESALVNTEEIGYTASRLDVFNEMIGEDGYYADERLRRAYESKVEVFQSFRHNDDLKKWIDDEWAIAIFN